MKSYQLMSTGAVLALLGCGAAYWWPSSSSRETNTSRVSPTHHPHSASAPKATSAEPEQRQDKPAPSTEGAGVPARDGADHGRRFQQLVAAGGAEINDAIESLLPLWVADDPLAARDYADALPEGPLRETILHRVIQYWSAKDTPAALDWISHRMNAAERLSLGMAVCHQIAKTDARSAISVAQSTGLAQENPDFVAYLIQVWANQDPSTSLSWVRSQPEGRLRNQYVAGVVLTMAQSAKYDTAVKLVFDEIPIGAQQDDALMTIVNQWANKDLESATVWVESFSVANPLRGRAIAEIEAARRAQTMNPKLHTTSGS